MFHLVDESDGGRVVDRHLPLHGEREQSPRTLAGTAQRNIAVVQSQNPAGHTDCHEVDTRSVATDRSHADQLGRSLGLAGSVDELGQLIDVDSGAGGTTRIRKLAANLGSFAGKPAEDGPTAPAEMAVQQGADSGNAKVLPVLVANRGFRTPGVDDNPSRVEIGLDRELYDHHGGVVVIRLGCVLGCRFCRGVRRPTLKMHAELVVTKKSIGE
jgi:hypothetical protein